MAAIVPALAAQVVAHRPAGRFGRRDVPLWIMVPAARWLSWPWSRWGRRGAGAGALPSPPSSDVGAAALAQRIRAARRPRLVRRGALAGIAGGPAQHLGLRRRRPAARRAQRPAGLVARRDNWRVDRMRGTGESDLVRDGGLSVRWNYEGNRVSFTPYSPIRLPDDADVVPVGARRTGCSPAPGAASSPGCPSRRVAGHERGRPAAGAGRPALDDRAGRRLGRRGVRAAAAGGGVRRSATPPPDPHAAS